MPDLVLRHFIETGIQDCRNVISRDEFDLSLPSLDAVMAAFQRDHFDDLPSTQKAWIEQMDPEDYDGLDPEACYRAWREGWLRTARSIVVRWMTDRLLSR